MINQISNFINFIIKNKKKLTKEFTDQIRDGPNKRDQIEYQEFDFHNEVRGDKFENIDGFIQKNNLLNLQRYGFFVRNLKGDILKKQQGIVRTNCLDCLDRTNFFQLKIAFYALNSVIFQQLNLNYKTSSDQDKFFKDFQECWGENGDNISMHYADTNATTSNAAKTGKQGVFGFLKGKISSAKRFFKGNLTDAMKQQTYCIILGEHYETQENLGFQEDMQKELKQREKDFITKSNVTIFAVTWNLNSYVPEKTTHMFNPIFKYNQKCDIVVVAFQELVELKPTNIMMSTHQKHNAQKFWSDTLINNLGTKDYFLVNTTNMVGVQTYIFAKNELNDRISDIEFDTVKCGFAGQLGNKGAVVVRFNVDDTSIAVLNCHLPAGQSKVSDRLNTLAVCQQQAFQQEGMAAYKREPLNKSDKLILIGDLNFRVDRKYADTIQILNRVNSLQKESKLQESQELIDEQILSYDQLINAKKVQSSQEIPNIPSRQQINITSNEIQQIPEKSQGIKNFYEKRIMFLPTYKFDSGTNTYDTSKKQRVPSYCDRILVNDIENDNVNVEQSILLYESCNVDYSDHKPVCAVLQFQVKNINKEAREQIIENILYNEAEKSKFVNWRMTNEPQTHSIKDLDLIKTYSSKYQQNQSQQNQSQYNNINNLQNCGEQLEELILFTDNSNNNNFSKNDSHRSNYSSVSHNIECSNRTNIDNTTNISFKSNNYSQSNTVWNFDINSVPNSNQNTNRQYSNQNTNRQFSNQNTNRQFSNQNTTRQLSNLPSVRIIKTESHQVDQCEDNIINSSKPFNLIEELKDIKLSQDISMSEYNQLEPFGINNKQQSEFEIFSSTPILKSQDSDRPQTPYNINKQHHQNNNLTQGSQTFHDDEQNQNSDSNRFVNNQQQNSYYGKNQYIQQMNQNNSYFQKMNNQSKFMNNQQSLQQQSYNNYQYK